MTINPTNIRAYSASEVYCIDLLNLMAREGWTDLSEPLMRHRARSQVTAIERTLSVYSTTSIERDYHRLEQASKSARSTTELFCSQLAIKKSNAEDLFNELLNKYHETTSNLDEDIGHQVELFLQMEARKFAASIDEKADRPGEKTFPNSQSTSTHHAIVGLALSGGGIRSASYSIGVLQTLAQYAILSSVHFVSGVSGGGYAASWLTTWASRHKDGIQGVQNELIDPHNVCGPLRWIRRYSSYLSTHLGLLSTDPWSLLVSYVRNWIPILLILLSGLTSLLLTPKILQELYEFSLHSSGDLETKYVALVITATTLFLFMLAVLRYLLLVRPVGRVRSSERNLKWKVWTATFLGSASLVTLLPSLETLRMLLSEKGLLDDSASYILLYYITLGILSYAIALLIAGAIRLARLPTDNIQNGTLRETIAAILDQYRFNLLTIVRSSIVGGTLFGGTIGALLIHNANILFNSRIAVTFGPVVVVLAIGLAEIIELILARRQLTTNERVWSAQVGGWVLGASLLAFVIFVASLWTQSLIGDISKHIAVGALILLLATFPLTVLFPPRRHIVFITDLTLAAFSLVTLGLISSSTIAHSSNTGFNLLLIFAFMILMLFVFGMLVDINKYSLHDIYKVGLVRTFLGASRKSIHNTNVERNEEGEGNHPKHFEQRRPAWYTNVDVDDDPSLALLNPTSKRRFPLLILNAAVNGASPFDREGRVPMEWNFIFSPSFIGSSAPGIGFKFLDPMVQKSDADDATISVGTSMAVSGAAMSPTSGRLTHPIRGFLFGLMNARLGLWVKNPRSTREPSPKTSRFSRMGLTGIRLLFEEVLCIRSKFADWIHLSDGGHFENTGIYELLSRGCGRIIAVDASCDPDCHFDDLSNLIRRARIDLGVVLTQQGEWSLFSSKVKGRRLGNWKGMRRDNRRAYMVFNINYGEGIPTGRLIYIKPSIYEGQEFPVEILQYWSQAPSFPHETTTNQFFTEAAIEAYRNLGEINSKDAIRAALNLSDRRRLGESDQKLIRIVTDQALKASPRKSPSG